MEKEEIYRKALIHDLREDQTLIGKCRVGTDFRIIKVNNVFCRYLECTPAQLIGVKFTEITSKDDNEVDVMNALAIQNGLIDGYQFPKKYKPSWLAYTVYAIIDVLAERDAKGSLISYNVEILEISKAEYLKIKKSILKQKSERLITLLDWTGGLTMKQAKGLLIWLSILAGSLSIAIQIKMEILKELFPKYFE